MSDQIKSKINYLVGMLSEGAVISSRWLRAHGYPGNLVAKYMASGWLESPARGAYVRKGTKPTWGGLLLALQQAEQWPIHAGGRFAMARLGHEHYLRLGQVSVLTLYGPIKLPAWACRLPLRESVQYCGRGPFGWAPPSFDSATPDSVLSAQGLYRVQDDSSAAGAVLSMAERAMLELCDEKPSAALVHEANALMQGLATLRPALVEALLQHCTSIKAKRLFLALAHRHHHAWLAHVDLANVHLGNGKRALVPGGRLDARFQITLPANLDEQLG